MQVGAVSQADFPLPTLGPLLHSLQQEVLRGRGFALLRGLPVEEWSRTEAVVAWWGIGLHWCARGAGGLLCACSRHEFRFQLMCSGCCVEV